MDVELPTFIGADNSLEGCEIRTSTMLLAVMVLCVSACKNETKTVSDTGTIIHFNLEGGFHGIVTDKGEHYLPENLSRDFQRDSLRVSFEGIVTDRLTV